MYIGVFLKKYFNYKRLRPEDLALILNYSRSQIIRWIKNESPVNSDVMILLTIQLKAPEIAEAWSREAQSQAFRAIKELKIA
jgi:hypothetical protein